jgi:F0F1-type ATP synthase membrane subunit b/b'
MSDAFYESLAVWSQVLGSFAFIIVLVWLFVRFVAPAVVASQQRKNAELAEAERRRDAARLDVEAARAERTSADASVAGILDRAKRDSERERERLVADANAEGERLIRNAEGELGRARYAARSRLRTELIAKAVEIAQAAAERLDADENAAVIRRVLQAIERNEARA